MKHFLGYLLIQLVGFFGFSVALAGIFFYVEPLQTALLGNLASGIREGTLRTQAFVEWSSENSEPFTLILGNSTTLYSVNPQFVMTDKVPTSFSLASNGQTLVMSREVLKWAIRQSKPARVLLDVNEEMCWNPGTESAFQHIQSNPRALDREFACLSGTFSNTHMALCTLCKGVSLAISHPPETPEHIQGHMPKYKPPTGPISCDSSLVATLPENQEALDDIITLCQSHDIALTLIHHPRLNGIQSDLSFPEGTRYIEGMNWEYAGVDTMFHDDHHLRSTIAPLYSQWVAEQLQTE